MILAQRNNGGFDGARTHELHDKIDIVSVLEISASNCSHTVSKLRMRTNPSNFLSLKKIVLMCHAILKLFFMLLQLLYHPIPIFKI